MGTHDVEREIDSERLREFTKKLLVDLRAIQRMLEDRRFETGVRRIGAEQELVLVDDTWRPAPVNLAVLEELGDNHFTTELGRFNIEFNLEPLPWGGLALRQMEDQLDRSLNKLREVCRHHGAEVVMTGILPTLDKADLGLEMMTPIDRYYALNEAMTRLRGSEYTFHLKGPDELNVTHDNVMVEACNTSFQVHFQVSPEEFAPLYNIAQTVAAPVVAAAANSPMLFGKRLWRETRIALFQQSIDTRSPTAHVRDQSPRVKFGDDWVDESVLEIFQEDVSRFRVLLAAEIDEDPFAVLEAGGVPKLKALQLFNSTIYRWTRPCYGISAGEPHLRIENRVLPSGPTVLDEMANAAFWFGLMSALSAEHDDIRRVIDFDTVKENFVAGARLGLGAQFTWLDGIVYPAAELIRERLLPLARRGLEEAEIEPDSIRRYLGTLEARVTSGKTGARWLVDSWAASRGKGSRAERLASLVAGTVSRQKQGVPVHEWELARLEEAGGWQRHYLKVGQIMTTDLFTINEEEVVDLAASMMDWRKIRHVPVENSEHELVGLVTHRAILRLVARDPEAFHSRSVPISEIMRRDLVTVEPETSTLDAIRLMREHRIGCLPVIEENRLVGIITERDFMQVAGQLLEAVLKDDAPEAVIDWLGSLGLGGSERQGGAISAPPAPAVTVDTSEPGDESSGSNA